MIFLTHLKLEIGLVIPAKNEKKTQQVYTTTRVKDTM